MEPRPASFTAVITIAGEMSGALHGLIHRVESLGLEVPRPRARTAER